MSLCMSVDVSMGTVMQRVLAACDLPRKVAIAMCETTDAWWSRMCDEHGPADLRRLRRLDVDARAELLAQLVAEWLDTPLSYRRFMVALACARMRQRMVKVEQPRHEAQKELAS